MRISPTIICISIWMAIGLALATDAMAQAGDKDRIIVILRPGLEKGQIEGLVTLGELAAPTSAA